MEVNQVKKIIEVLLFITDNPIPLEKLKNVLGEAADGKDVEKLIKDMDHKVYEQVCNVAQLPGIVISFFISLPPGSDVVYWHYIL